MKNPANKIAGMVSLLLLRVTSWLEMRSPKCWRTRSRSATRTFLCLLTTAGFRAVCAISAIRNWSRHVWTFEAFRTDKNEMWYFNRLTQSRPTLVTLIIIWFIHHLACYARTADFVSQRLSFIYAHPSYKFRVFSSILAMCESSSSPALRSPHFDSYAGFVAFSVANLSKIVTISLYTALDHPDSGPSAAWPCIPWDPPAYQWEPVQKNMDSNHSITGLEWWYLHVMFFSPTASLAFKDRCKLYLPQGAQKSHIAL